MKTIGRGKHANRTGEVAHVAQLAMGANCASGSLGALRCKAVSQYQILAFECLHNFRQQQMLHSVMVFPSAPEKSLPSNCTMQLSV